MEFSSVTIQPEQNGLRNWTMVLATLSYRLPWIMPESYGFSPSSEPGKSIKAKQTPFSTLDTKVSPIP